MIKAREIRGLLSCRRLGMGVIYALVASYWLRQGLNQAGHGKIQPAEHAAMVEKVVAVVTQQFDAILDNNAK